MIAWWIFPYFFVINVYQRVNSTAQVFTTHNSYVWLTLPKSNPKCGLAPRISGLYKFWYGSHSNLRFPIFILLYHPLSGSMLSPKPIGFPIARSLSIEVDYWVVGMIKNDPQVVGYWDGSFLCLPSSKWNFLGIS